MNGRSTVSVFLLAGAAWIITAPLYFVGCLLALLAWPIRTGFVSMWWMLED